jgi:hypothetical protein
MTQEALDNTEDFLTILNANRWKKNYSM